MLNRFVFPNSKDENQNYPLIELMDPVMVKRLYPASWDEGPLALVNPLVNGFNIQNNQYFLINLTLESILVT